MSSGTCERVSLVAAAILFLISQAVLAQGQQGGGGKTGAGAGTGTGGAGTGGGTQTPSSRPPTTTQPRQPQQQPQQQIQQPIFVSGRVLLEDGTPPTESVVMERVCNGQPKSEGYTDSKGYFGFELGRRNNGMIHDASEDPGNDPFNTGGFGRPGAGSGGLNNTMIMGGSDTRLMGCELRARLAGYRSQIVNLSMRRPMDNPDVGVILLHRIGETEGGTISAISLAAPKDAKKAYEKGLDAVKKKKIDDAAKNLEKAVELYPKYATAWFELGRVKLGRGDKDGARSAFETSVQSDPKFVSPYLELAIMEMLAQKWEQVVDLTSKAIKLDPFSYPQSHFYNAVANFNLKNVEAAEKSAREAERLDTRHTYPQALHLLGVILAQQQDYKGAAERLRSYMKFAPANTDFTNVKTQLGQFEEKVAQSTGTAPKQ